MLATGTILLFSDSKEFKRIIGHPGDFVGLENVLMIFKTALGIG